MKAIKFINARTCNVQVEKAANDYKANLMSALNNSNEKEARRYLSSVRIHIDRTTNILGQFDIPFLITIDVNSNTRLKVVGPYYQYFEVVLKPSFETISTMAIPSKLRDFLIRFFSFVEEDDCLDIEISPYGTTDRFSGQEDQ